MPPGVPETPIATSVTSNSLTLQARLSTMGTSPLLSASFVISGPDGFVSRKNETGHVLVGEVVETSVTGLSPGTTYSVVVYASNAAGRGPASMEQHFQTCMHIIMHMTYTYIHMMSESPTPGLPAPWLRVP